MKSQNKAYLFAIAAILCWSTIASAFKLTLQHLDYLNTLLYSSAVATLVLFVLLLLQRKTSRIKQLSKKDLIRAALRGALNPFLYYMVLLKAYDLLKAQEAGTLNYIWPITLVLLSIPLLKQKIGWLSLLAIFISFSGILVISTEGRITSLEFREPLGVLLAVGSSIFWALYWILNLKDKKDEVLKLFLNFFFGTSMILVWMLIRGQIILPSPAGVFGTIYIGIFEMGLTFFLWMMGLKYSENTARVSNLVYLSPFISLLIIHFAVNEAILPATIGGLILIVSGILLQHLSRKAKHPIRK
ncbi:MAG TPA: DMT family transporter [Bacteroidales bacterium]|nr:DMT family transporter [Bacteroidales bacterium]HRX98242.1 DMT family transporter [Bacteroidales bacterium]